MRVFHDVKVGLDEDLEEKLKWLAPNYSQYRIIRQSVDARQRHFPHYVYSLEVSEGSEALPKKEFNLSPCAKPIKSPPIIIGAGPAGLFCALRFAERGVPCILLERGSESSERIKSINRFWRYGELDLNNNVCFGEGGAGLYSDGKLVTRIKSPYISYVMNRLVKFGAPKEIEYLANPHVGSDRIRRVIPKMRKYIQENKGIIKFNAYVTELLTSGSEVIGVKTQAGDLYYSDHIILATGHSAEDIFTHISEKGIFIEGKSYALGLRIEHPQKIINKIQYREAWDHPKLGAANYKLAHHDKNSNTGVYSFCMCPGGYVLSSGTEPNSVVVNGMSNYSRGSAFANSAVVVTIDHQKSFGSDIWGGMKLRKQTENEAYLMVQRQQGTKEIPAQRLVDFIQKKSGPSLPSSSPSHVLPARLDQLLPDTIYKNLITGLERFGKQMNGFLSEEAQLHGVESRTSCPLRITRNPESLQSLSHSGLYPCGEGAGYAGGITSAACDGIKVAEKIME